MLRKTRVFIGFAIALLVVQPQIVAARDVMFRAQNDVLYYEEGCAAATVGIGSAVAGGSGGGGGCGGTPEENKKQIWSFLKSKGLTDDAAAGIMGNMQQESSFNPKANNGRGDLSGGSGGGCRGVVQWCGSRNTGLDSFAAGKGTSWDCLGTQLEYMWYEMTETEQGQYNGAGDHLEIPLADALNGKPFSRSSEYSGSGAYKAGTIFHDYFERANTATGENLGRGEKAEGIYQEFTGQSADTSLLSDNSSSAKGGNACPSNSQSGGGIMSEDCKALVQQYDTLKASGKISVYGENTENINHDLQNCTTDQIECGTGGGKGGVHPRTVRALVAAAENSGASNIQQWNFNTGHDCDEFRHPMGMAMDLYCIGNEQGQRTATEDCNKLFKYFYDNYDALGITELIWTYPPPEYSCSDPKINCYTDGHRNHIHISTEVKDGANA